MSVMYKEQVFQLKLAAYQAVLPVSTDHASALTNGMELYFWLIKDTPEYEKEVAAVTEAVSK